MALLLGPRAVRSAIPRASVTVSPTRNDSPRRTPSTSRRAGAGERRAAQHRLHEPAGGVEAVAGAPLVAELDDDPVHPRRLGLPGLAVPHVGPGQLLQLNGRVLDDVAEVRALAEPFDEPTGV